MVTPREILSLSAADMNDNARQVYTDAVLIPYLNMAVQEFIEKMQDSNVPITTRDDNKIIKVPPSKTAIAVSNYVTPLPTEWIDVLPYNIYDIREIWESDNNQDWTRMNRTDKISPNLMSGDNSNFHVYEWHGYHMEVPPVNKTMYLDITYVLRHFPTFITIADLDTPYYVDGLLFLAHKTAALASILILQDETRGSALNELAEQAIEREINIPTKGTQQMATRRRPFRSSYKMRGYNW